MAKVKVTGNKFEEKMYHHHTNFPGGLRSKSMRELFEQNPADVLIAAVSRMLPKNKQREERLKRLKIS
jgi:large subunit ribosomal protein L13